MLLCVYVTDDDNRTFSKYTIIISRFDLLIKKYV